jgi:hypothetical protein
LKALRLARCLPACDLGPVECVALALLMRFRMCLRDIVFAWRVAGVLGPGGAIRAKSLRYGVKYSAAGGESVQKRVTQRRKARKEDPRGYWPGSPGFVSLCAAARMSSTSPRSRIRPEASFAAIRSSLEMKNALRRVLASITLSTRRSHAASKSTPGMSGRISMPCGWWPERGCHGP